MIRFFALVISLCCAVFPLAAQPVTEAAQVCRTGCESTCRQEGLREGCNPAMGLTSCRIKQEKCVQACERKCPKK